MRYVITAGGTGGHIYPALAIINKIKSSDKHAEFLYIGTHNRMEKDIIPSLSIPYKSLEVTGLKRKISLKNIKTVINFLSAIKEAKIILKNFKPDIVIGCGGYVTAPVIYAASKLKIKSVIHEQNSALGLSNKLLLKYCDKLFTSFRDTKNINDISKVVYSKNPCGQEALLKKNKPTNVTLTHKSNILIVMGSLGSMSVNNKIVSMLSMFNQKDYGVTFVTGKDLFDKIDKSNVPSNVTIVNYVENLPALMSKIDIMVSRAGASTISEINALEVPTIFIPSPYVTDNHQYKNAMELVNEDKALIIEEKDLKGDILIRTIEDLLNNKIKLKKLKTNLHKDNTNNSLDIIYREIYKILKGE